MSGYTGPMTANVFQAGNTCPFCQESIAEGQAVVSCLACGSLHHDTCWHHKGGCSSYHCDAKVKSESPDLRAEVVITATDAARATVPPKPVRPGAAEAARPFLQRQPTRLSWLAVASVVLTGLALLGLAGLVLRHPYLPLGGIAAAMVSLIVGVTALVVINSGRKVHGLIPAGIAITISAILIPVFLIDFESMQTLTTHQHRMDFQISESRPTEQQLAAMTPPRAKAMRANVVITSKPSGLFASQFVTGSGVILKVEGQKAWILTNRHVVTGGDPTGSGAGRTLDVAFYNGESSVATVEWLPPAPVDLAVLVCQALTLTQIEPIEVLATAVAQGEPVFAVGNPQNLPWSYAEGVISSVRNQTEGGQEIEIYQTQTPINSGNSGGGLYTQGGRLIGINTWTHDKSVSEGLSFAISSRTLLKLLGAENIARFLKLPAEAPPAPEPPAKEPPAKTPSAKAPPAKAQETAI
jgi:S1-C subfamily serine protease